MANSITTLNEVSNSSPIISHANPLRGASYHESAMEFVRRYPVGTELTATEFDNFSIAQNLIKPPSSYDRGSDGWQAFLQRRHQAKVNLNKAGSHPRMSESGLTPFSIGQKGHGIMVVQTPMQAAVTTPIGKQVESLVETKKTKLRHLLESVDFNALPPSDQAQIANMYETIADFQAQTEFTTARMTQKFERVRASIERLVSQGVVRPVNGGITALIEPDNQDTNS